MPTDDETTRADTAAAADAKTRRRVTAQMLSEQANHCATLGSRLYAQLLADAATDCAAGGPTWTVLQPIATTDWQAALALRFMAAIHRLVLEGGAPRLAQHYPSAGGTQAPDRAWPALRDVLVERQPDITRLAAQGCQTNEVGRCRALLVGFLTIATRTRLPVRLLEVGASGGLNLRWDHYRVADSDGRRAWGPADSPVQLIGPWEIDESLLDAPVDVVQRRGCDPNPVDPRTHDGQLRLSSALWGDQVERLERLRGAVRIAEHVPVRVDAAPARTWVPEQLGRVASGAVTVVFHSVVWQYLPDADRTAMAAAIAAAGAAATDAAPVAWLSMEPDDPGRVRSFDVRLRLWPGGTDEVVARSGAHGFPVRRPGRAT